MNIYISILTSQENELEKKKKMLKDKENEIKIKESILILITKDKKLIECNLNETIKNHRHKRKQTYDKISSNSIIKRESMSGVKKIKNQVNRQKSVPFPRKNNNNQFREHKENNSNSIHQIEDSLLDKLEQNIPVMQCIQNDKLITDSIQLPNQNSGNDKLINSGVKQKANRMRDDDSYKKNKDSESKNRKCSNAKDINTGEININKSFNSISSKSNSIKLKTDKKQLFPSKTIKCNKLNKPIPYLEYKHENKTNSTKEIKSKINIKPIPINVRTKLNEIERKSSRNKIEYFDKNNTLQNSSVKEIDKFLKYQSMKFIQIMNKMVIHNNKRMKKESMNFFLQYNLKIKKKLINSKAVCNIKNQVRRLCLKKILNTLINQVLPQYLKTHGLIIEVLNKFHNDCLNDNSCELEINDFEKDHYHDSIGNKISGCLNRNELIKPEIKIVPVDYLSEDNDDELDHCDFKTYQQSLKKIKELTKETQYLENNMKLFANQINNKSPTV